MHIICTLCYLNETNSCMHYALHEQNADAVKLICNSGRVGSTLFYNILISTTETLSGCSCQSLRNNCNCNNKRNTRKSIFFTCNDTVDPENVLKWRASNESEMSSFDRNLVQCQHEPLAVPQPRFCYPCSVWSSSPWLGSILARYISA